MATPRLDRLILFQLLVLASSVCVTLPVHALQFQHLTSFATGVFGPDGAAPGEGTPRGLAVRADGSVVIADSLDDQLYETDSNGTFIRNMQTNAYCELSGPPTCAPGVPTAHASPFPTGVSIEPGTGHLWVLEDPNSGATLLQELDSDGLFLNETDISFALGAAGGLTFDQRNGDVLVLQLSGGSNRIVRFDEHDPGDFTSVLSYTIPDTSGPQGISPFDDDTYLVVDASNNALYEYSLPTGAGTAVLEGTSTLLGFDLSTTDPLGIEYDALNQRLYISDNNLGDQVHVFALVPEPGTGLLLGFGLAALAANRHRRAASRTRIDNPSVGSID